MLGTNTTAGSACGKSRQDEATHTSGFSCHPRIASMILGTIRSNMTKINPPQHGNPGTINAPVDDHAARRRLNQITDGAYGGQLGRCIETENTVRDGLSGRRTSSNPMMESQRNNL